MPTEGYAAGGAFRLRWSRRSSGDALASLDFFLLERYYLFATRARSLVRAQVAHAPYRPRDAQVDEFSIIPAQLDGFTELADPAENTCFVDGFDVRIFATEKI